MRDKRICNVGLIWICRTKAVAQCRTFIDEQVTAGSDPERFSALQVFKVTGWMFEKASTRKREMCNPQPIGGLRVKKWQLHIECLCLTEH